MSWQETLTTATTLTNLTKNGEGGEDSESGEGKLLEQKNKKKLIILNEKVNELKKYCNDLRNKGHKLTYENLCFNFDTDFIEECKKQKILIPLPDGNYDFGGS